MEKINCLNWLKGKFSLWTNCLVYKSTETQEHVQIRPDVFPQPRDVEKEKKELEDAQRALDDETVKELRDEVIEKREDYNDYIKRHRLNIGFKFDAKWKFWEGFSSTADTGGFGLRAMHPNWLLEQTTKNVSALKNEIADRRTKLDSHADVDDKHKANLKSLLMALEKSLTEYENYMKQVLGNYEAILQRHGDNLVNRHRIFQDHLDVRTGYEAQPVYQRMQNQFDTALSDPELQSFWEAEGRVSPQRQAETRQLFFAMLAENTRGFKDNRNEGFILGPDFTDDDPDANRKNFPFIYQKWLEKNGINLARINEDQVRVADLEKQVAGFSSVEDLIKNEASAAPNLRQISDAKLKEAGAIPPPGTPAEKLWHFWEKRHSAIADLAAQYRRGKSRLKDDIANGVRGVSPADVENFQQKAQKLELHERLAQAKIDFYRVQTEKAGIDALFTRAELSKEEHENWLMRVTMLQFRRAMDIVDHPVSEHGTQQFNYHPAVRRMLIAMVCRTGVSGWRYKNGAEIYDDSIADEYYSMLSQLAFGGDFEARAKGKFVLPEATKAFLLLAYYGNQIQIQTPLLQQRIKKQKAAIDSLDKPSKERMQAMGIVPSDIEIYQAQLDRLEGILTREALKQRVEKLKQEALKYLATFAAFSPAIDVNDADPENQKQNTEQQLIVLYANAQTPPIPAESQSTPAGQQQLVLAKAWALTSADLQAKALMAMLNYIDNDSVKYYYLKYPSSGAENTQGIKDWLKSRADAIKPRLHSLQIFPDATNLLSERKKCEAVLLAAARDNMSDAFRLAGNRDAQLLLGYKYAKTNPNSDAAAALVMLDYINADPYFYERQVLVQEGINIGLSLSTSDAGLAFLALGYLKDKKRLREWSEHSILVEQFIREGRVNTPEAREFLRRVMTETTIEGRTNEPLLADFTAYMNQVEISYDMFDVREASTMDYLDRLGINTEGMYHVYLEYLKKNPEMRVDQWYRYFESADPQQFGKLVAILDAIIPPGEAGGKMDFMIMFQRLHEERETNPQNRDQRMIVMAIYERIKEELTQREAIEAAERAGDQELQARLEGINIGDRITKYGNGVLDMIMGPGQSWTNRAAGVALAYGAWKLIHKAWKGGKGSGPLRLLFMAGAAELALKEITGRGLIDRAGLFDTLPIAIEGTYKAVLVQQYREDMQREGILAEEHTAALYELDTVPFHLAMEWYDSTKVDGSPRPGVNADDLWRRMQINVDQVRGNRKVEWKQVDAEARAKVIIKRSMETLFAYTAMKDDKTGHDAGREILQERYIQAVRDPNFTEKQARHTKLIPTELAALYREKENELTWAIVMSSEIDRADAERTKGQSLPEQVADYAVDTFNNFMRWTEDEVLGRLSPMGRAFMRRVGEKAKDIKKMLQDLGIKADDTLHFTAESVSATYEGNKITIRHFLDDHIELVVDGIKLPFAIIYGVDQAVIPWVTTKIRQIKEILRSDKITTTKTGGELTTDDIMADSVLALDVRDLSDLSKNPEYRYFGQYQKPFRVAFVKGGYYDASDKSPSDAEWGPHYMIGYYISTIKKDDPELNYTANTPPEEILNQMQSLSFKKARQTYIDKGVPPEFVDRFMYPIHLIVQRQSGKEGITPEALSVFWRMPLPGSLEYFLKTAPGNRWTDYMDPNQYKHREAVMFDPRLGLIDNIERAMGLKLRTTRKTAGALGIALVQWMKLPVWTAEKVGKIAGFATEHILRSPKEAQWVRDLMSMDAETQQTIDEALCSASDHEWAFSAFYKNQRNAWWYHAAWEYSMREQEDTYLGEVDQYFDKSVGGGRLSTKYMEKPPTWDNPLGGHMSKIDFEQWLKDDFDKKYPHPSGVTLP